MRRWLGRLWAWCWLPAVCLLAMFAVWVVRTLQWFDSFGLRIDAPVAVRLRDAGVHEFEHMLRGLRLQFTGAAPAAVAEVALPSLELFVASDDLARLDADLPYSGFDYVDGVLRSDGKEQQVRLRYRGDAMPHWAYAKKSLRLRTRKDELFLGMHAFNLVAPRLACDGLLSYRLAQRLGLMVPRTQPVQLFLNGRFHGLYVLVEQIDEGTLRAHDRMPGDVFSGKLTGLEAFTGVPNRLFADAALWDKVAENNHYAAGSKAPLEALVQLLNTPADEVGMQQLGELLDLEAFARLSVLELLTQSHHCDQQRNWRLFWDPWRRRFEPIAWDLVGWQDAGGEFDLQPITSTLHAQLHKHAGFLAARVRVLRQFFACGLDQQLLADLRQLAAQVEAPLRADANAEPPDDAALAAAMPALLATVQGVLQQLRQQWLGAPERLRYRLPATAGAPLLLQLDSRRGVEQLVLAFASPVQPRSATLRLLRPEGGDAVELGSRCRSDGDQVVVDLPLVCESGGVLGGRGPDGGRRGQQVLPTSYELQLDGVDLRQLRGVAGGDAADARAFTADAGLRPTAARDLFQAVPEDCGEPLQLAGEQRIDGVRHYRRPVRIAAGTRFRLGPGACLLFHGRVDAAGSAAQPIEFQPAADDQEPWGTVALDGQGCSGSRLRGCRFRGGSGHKQPLCEYTAMFSVHGARDVEVADCEFRDSKVTDDMIHVVYAQVAFERVLLQRALMDALDCDISEVAVRDSRFEHSGNDGIDLMTTRAMVQGCRFLRCGDKGISIGEDTRLVAVDDVFERCQKAMEAKDGSIAAVLHADVLGCVTALNAYKKNWRYDAGGQLTVWRSRLLRNLHMPTADRSSELSLSDCQTDAGLEPRYALDGRTAKNHAAASGCDAGEQTLDARPLPFPAALDCLRALAEPAWRAAAGDRRGAAERSR